MLDDKTNALAHLYFTRIEALTAQINLCNLVLVCYLYYQITYYFRKDN